MPVGRAKRGHLVRTDDDSRHRLALLTEGSERFDERRVVAPEIGEDVVDAEPGGDLNDLLRRRNRFVLAHQGPVVPVWSLEAESGMLASRLSRGQFTSVSSFCFKLTQQTI